MPNALFRQMADTEGWSEATQIGLLLRFIENGRDPSVFLSFLSQCRADSPAAHTDPADRFMWQVVELLGNPGLALTSAFQDLSLIHI